MKTKTFSVTQNQRGALTELTLNQDPTKMNWVIDPKYLTSVGYEDADKLFGEFTITIDDKKYNSIDLTPIVSNNDTTSKVTYQLADSVIEFNYQLTNESINWQIKLVNTQNKAITIDNFGVWTSFAYVMFRDTNVHKNANQSTAAFSSISDNYTKIALMRRDHTNPNLGFYQTSGEVRSIGTFNEYNNRFFENVSPSLDGMLFHQLILAGGYPDHNGPQNDWIYSQEPLKLAANESKIWEFALAPFSDQADFQAVGAQFNHPIINFSPLITLDQPQVITIQSTDNNPLVSVKDVHMANQLQSEELTNDLTDNGKLTYSVHGLGEHKVIFAFKDGTSDMIVFNVMSSIKELLRNRAEYISKYSYAGNSGPNPYSFGPVSNQGESLGKMTFVIQECLLDSQVANRKQCIQQVETSAVKYVIPKWFVDGDLKKPAKVYGDFYRVMDLEYIAHLFFLLSQCDASDLKLNTPQTYLKWAAQIFDVRVNPDLHDNERGKAEAQMMGQYFLYFNDLLTALKANHLDQEYKEISASWKAATNRMATDAPTLAGAMTEHFFDNAGFGPAAGALALAGHPKEAAIYGELLKANIGFSNDFRSQSPDRWWEALSYMIHSLWGGVTAASALITGRELFDPELVEAAYRGTVAVLYMYDSNATATDRKLAPGEAASTYSIAGPNLNRPDLSRNRFGQSIFASDGGIFTRLFPDGYTGEDDWDMGEELVAYLNGFGQEVYVYQDNGRFKAINGRIIKQENNMVIVESNAPYPQRLIDLTNHQIIETNQREIKYQL